MTVIAALSGPVPKAGVIAAALLAAVTILHAPPRLRAAAMLAAAVLAPALLLADIWHSPQLGVVHRHPLAAAAAAAAALLAVAAVAALVRRVPWLLALLVIVALPFRIPVAAGGTTANLLVPLYLVVGAGVLASALPTLFGTDGRRADPGGVASAGAWVERLLAVMVVLYALQAVYSSDFEKALQQVVFFYVPFALLYCLLRELQWTPWLIRRCAQLVVAMAVAFVAIGFVEYATKTLLLNPKLVAENDLHTYFTVNSVFFDPDIYGRFLALVMVLVAARLLYARQRREVLLATGVLAILWGGLVLTLSRSSIAALLLGLGVLGALRWRAKPFVVVGAVVVAIGIVAVVVSPKTFGLNQGLNGASAGRAGLVSGATHLFATRPVWGHGSGSFENSYRALHPGSTSSLSASHTIALTIAAEQGLIGELPYLALLLAAIVLLARGARVQPARAAIAAAFIALVLHTELYADFLEDPATWLLLGIGVALATGGRLREEGPLPRAAGRTKESPARVAVQSSS